jgi:AraC-like DNA-binding protein
MLLSISPAKPLATFVTGYWFVEDLVGAYRGNPISTSPQPGAVLTINLGRPNSILDGLPSPRASLLGVQTLRRHWRSHEDTSFVMIMLSCAGLANLFPYEGSGAVDDLIDLSALIGDSLTSALVADVSARADPALIAQALDIWLMRRLERVSRPRELPMLVAACDLLASGTRVQQVANALDVSRRHLSRWFVSHIGLGPKTVMDLHRFNQSLHAVQNESGDALAGFSDQSHQIRDWRRRLGSTPSRYIQSGRSPMAAFFNTSAKDAPAFYL